MKKILLILCLFYHQSFTQKLFNGGLQGSESLIITPKGIVKEHPRDYKPLGFSEPTGKGENGEKAEKHAYEINVDLPNDWKWIMATNVALKSGKKTNFFFHHSWLGTTEKVRTNARRRNFPTDITQQLKSNAYVVGIHRESLVENEAFIELISPVKQTVILELPKEVFKLNRRLTYEMEAWEAKFVHVVIPPKEYSNMIWKETPDIRPKMVLKNDWDFTFSKENPFKSTSKKDFEKVSVPHVFEYKQNFDSRQIHDTLDISEMYKRDIGWYKKTFTIPQNWKGKYLRINFLAANKIAEVWLNDKYLGKHLGGYTDFHWGINDHVLWDKPNTLIVKVDNQYNFDIAPHSSDYNEQGGIYREVELMAWNPVFVKDIAITTPKVSPTLADVHCKITFNNKAKKDAKVKVITNLINPNGEIFATRISKVDILDNTKPTITEQFNDIENPLLWFPENPFLYKVMCRLVDENEQIIDEKIENFGIRTYVFDKDKGFTINGVKKKLQGVNHHQDNFMTGWANDSTAKRKDYLLMKEMGVNFIRMSHYPHHPYELYLCDSLGIMVWEEIPVVNSVGREEFIKNTVKMTEEMINRDKNHPSILTWGVGNEYYRDYFVKEQVELALECTKAVIKKIKELDLTRPTTQAQNDLADDRIMPLTDLHGRNRYFGWYTGGSAYLGFEGYDGFAKGMEIERKLHPEWNVIISEYGAEAKYGYHVEKPERFDHSETYQLAFHKAYWEYIKKTDWISGSTLWNMFDFVSFAKIGNIPHINQKGTMTYDRKKKSLFYYYQSEWTTTPMVHINAHNQYHIASEVPENKPLEVFSNCESVELFLNGISQGIKKKADGYSWNITYQIGYNNIKAVGSKEGETVKDSHTVHFSIQNKIKVKSNGKDSD
jgi:beta-galactosidase